MQTQSILVVTLRGSKLRCDVQPSNMDQLPAGLAFALTTFVSRPSWLTPFSSEQLLCANCFSSNCLRSTAANS